MTTRTRTLTPREAEDRLQEKREYAESLDQRLLEGDSSISAAKRDRAWREVTHAELVAKGAKVAAEQAAAEERRDRGTQLHEEYVADMTEALIETEQRMTAATEAIAAAVDALDRVAEVRDIYHVKWREVFRDDTDHPVALQFKAGQRSGGTFGALDAAHVVGRVDAVEMVAALVGHVVRGRDRGRMTSRDDHWHRQLTPPPVGAGLRQLRELIDFVKEETDDN